MTNSNIQTQPEESNPFSQEDLEKKKENFKAEVRNFRSQKISKVRTINHWWNISLTVAGITLTLVTTVLGVVESETFRNLIKFGIGLSGALAIAAQSANSEFRVRKKAGEYSIVEAKVIILEHKIPYAKNETELNKLRDTYYELRLETAEIEASVNQED
ncbi:MAG: hypothetical protein QNJ36_17895 [Calothrix sp. MO_167.B42]|nr:hypothetical protein [Calothrix sp. MO_167.B42]